MSIVGKITGRLYIANHQQMLSAAQSYDRRPDDSKFSFGREVTVIEIRGGNVDEFDRGTRAWKTSYR